jgi:hypothetical protein
MSTTHRRKADMAEREIDSFWFDLTLVQSQGDPNVWTGELGIAPRHARVAGTKIKRRDRVSKRTVWIAKLGEGKGHDEQSSAGLKAVLNVFSDKAAFLRDFVQDGGEALLTISHGIPLDNGVLSDIRLEPAFLLPVSQLGITLQLRGWSAGEWPAKVYDSPTFENA